MNASAAWTTPYAVHAPKINPQGVRWRATVGFMQREDGPRRAATVGEARAPRGVRLPHPGCPDDPQAGKPDGNDVAQETVYQAPEGHPHYARRRQGDHDG